MITHIKGRLVEKSPTSVVIECNGIGYMINISLNTFSQIPDNENLKLFTHLQVKEDSHTLYGFFSIKERQIFRLLISVNGIGPSIARTMHSSISPDQIIDAISRENVSLIQSVKGIGSKTAQRVIIDLHDKILKVYELDELSAEQCTQKSVNHIEYSHLASRIIISNNLTNYVVINI